MLNSTSPAPKAEGAQSLAYGKLTDALSTLARADSVRGSAPFRAIAYRPIYRQLAGGKGAAILLAQMLYWSQRSTHDDGRFWKTVSQWTQETGLTHSEQKTARRQLRQRGFHHEQRGGDRNKLWFWVDVQAVLSALITIIECGDFSHISAANLAALVRRISTDECGDSGHVPRSPENKPDKNSETTPAESLNGAEKGDALPDDNRPPTAAPAIDRYELANDLAFYGVGQHQIEPAIQEHAAELARRVAFLPFVKIRKSTAAYLMHDLHKPAFEPNEYRAANTQKQTDDEEAIASLLNRAATAKAMP
jgi:hypothetical protein